ncbi:MAG: hypothetical protein WDZ63_16375 [Burkholderiales bacterium]
MFSLKTTFIRRLLLVTLALCLQGAQAVMVTHVLDPCDFIEEEIQGQGCTQACDQCAPQTSAPDALAASTPGAVELVAAHVLATAPHDAPHLAPHHRFHGRAPPPELSA